MLAAAVMELYPGVKISIGPPIENGFYYDFEFPEGVTVSDADFERIEQKMREHVKADEQFVREDVTVAEALERFRAEDQHYKVELIEDLVATTDRRRDRQPLHERPVHRPLPRPARARARSASRRSSCSRSPARTGAATRTASMLTRIYGTAFFSKEELARAPRAPRAGAARDHRKLGRELGLFTFSEVVARARAFWLPAGHGDLQRARRAQRAR